MMSEYTKGPWTLKREAHCISVENSNSIVSEQYLPDSDGRDDSYDNQEKANALADAHLIAAAPDLLEALRQCVKWHKTVIGDTYFPIESVQLAIDKATTIQ